MAKNPDTPKKPCKTPKSKTSGSKANSKASRPDVQPIGPALAELLNPAINRGEAALDRQPTRLQGKAPPSPKAVGTPPSP